MIDLKTAFITILSFNKFQLTILLMLTLYLPISLSVDISHLDVSFGIFVVEQRFVNTKLFVKELN